jgi:hypothetical protein
LGQAEGRSEGEAEGLVLGVLTVLRGRGIPLSEATEQRIRACTDVERLTTWPLTAAGADRSERIVGDD